MHGIASIGDVRGYMRLARDAEEFIHGLADDCERRVMEEIYLRGMTAIEASMKLYYSERQLRRIHARVLNRMELAKNKTYQRKKPPLYGRFLYFLSIFFGKYVCRY